MSAHILSTAPISFERCADGSIRVFRQDTDNGTSSTAEVCFIDAAEWDELVTAVALPIADAALAPAEDPAANDAPAA